MNIKEILNDHNIDFIEDGHHHCSKGFIQLDCPFCSPDWKSYRLGYNLSKGYFTCWSCGGLYFVKVLSTLLKIPYKKSKEIYNSLDVRYERVNEEKGKLVLPFGLKEIKKCHKKYLLERDLDPLEILSKWDIKGFDITGGEYKWRIWIPIKYMGETISWTTRSILEDARIRYITARPDQEVYSAKGFLFGEDFTSNGIIISEGPFDVFKIGCGCVATLGLGYTQKQINRMIKYPIRVVCFDSDDKAQERAEKLCNTLEVFPGTTTNVVLDSKDCGSASKKEIKLLRKMIE